MTRNGGVAANLDDQVRATMSRLSLEQKVGQLFVTCVYGSDAERPAPGDEARNRDEFGLASPADVVRKYQLGGVVYFTWAGNTHRPEQVAWLSNGLQRAAMEDGPAVPLFVATDQEQGAVVRLGPPFTELPGNMALGAGGSDRDAQQAALVTGRELRAVGINQDYAPAVDVNVNPRNPVIGVRSFGSDPELVARLAAAQVRGYREAGIIATAKHFPGHGDTSVDSHVGVPVVKHEREEWDRVDAAPFRAVVAEGVDSVMTGHIVFPALDPSGDPATLSAPVLTGVLREELGFDGLVVTDSLRMQGVRSTYGDDRVPVLALLAGADQLLMPPNLDLAFHSVLAAVRAGELTEERIDRSVERVLRLKYRRGLFAGPYVRPDAAGRIVGMRRHSDSADRVADRTVTVVRDDAGLVPLDPAWQAVLVVGSGERATSTLAKELEAYASWTCAVDTGDSPGDDEIKSAVARAKHHDVVVLLTRKAWDIAGTDATGGQRRLMAALLGTRARVVVVAVRDPYDLAYANDATTCIATYCDNDTSMRALARVLVGAVEPRGQLPVELTGT